MKKLITILTLITIIPLSAQVSFGAKIGANGYAESNNYSEVKTQLSFEVGYRYWDDYVNSRLKIYYGDLKNEGIDCGFDTNYAGIGTDFMFNLNKIFDKTYDKFMIEPFVGIGYARYDGDKVLTLTAGTMFSVKIDEALSLNAEYNRTGISGLDNTLGGHPTFTRGIDAYNDAFLLGATITFAKREKNNTPEIVIPPEPPIKTVSTPIIEKVCDCDPPVILEQKPQLEKIYFSYDSSEIPDYNTDNQEKNLNILKEQKGKILITGYACPKGDEEYNKKLAKERAKAYMDHLNKKGIPYSRMSYQGKIDPQLAKSSFRVEVEIIESR